MFRLKFIPGAEREIEKLRRRLQEKEFERLCMRIDALTSEPRPQGVRKLKDRAEVYRTREGDYRIIYRINDAERLVEIIDVARRNEGTYRT